MRLTISDAVPNSDNELNRSLEVSLTSARTIIGPEDRILFTATSNFDQNLPSYSWYFNNHSASEFGFISSDYNLLVVDGAKAAGLESFQVKVECEYRGARVSTSISIEVNSPPTNGNCTVSNETAVTFSTLEIICAGWVDIHTPFAYNFELHGIKITPI